MSLKTTEWGFLFMWLIIAIVVVALLIGALVYKLVQVPFGPYRDDCSTDNPERDYE